MYSCGNSSEETQSAQNLIEDTNSLYGDKDIVFPELSESAKIYVEKWGVFEDFQQEAKSINGSNIESLRDKTERLRARVDSLTKKLPDTLFVSPIYSRVIVAKTRAELLHQEAHKPRIDSTKLQFNITEMNIATRNLIIQINEKFQKDETYFQLKDNEKKELEKQKRFLDSVYKAEREDLKNNNL